MVDYNVWFEICLEVGEAETAGGLDQQQRRELVSELADYWNDHKSELAAMTRDAALERAREEIGPA